MNWKIGHGKWFTIAKLFLFLQFYKPKFDCNFKKLKIQETKLYVWNIIFACFINLNKMPLKIEIHELLFAQQA